MRQECPLASYLFLLVIKVMNAITTKEEDNGIVKGVYLYIEGRQ